MVFRGSFVILALINKREEIDLPKLACIGLVNQRFCKARLPRIKLGRGRKPTGGLCQTLKVAVKDTVPTGANPDALSVTSRQEFLQASVQAAVISKLMSF